MGNISHAFILSLFIVATCLTATAQVHYTLPHSALTLAPAPSPTHHHHHHPHHPGGHHHHAHSPFSAPVLAPTYPSISPTPSKPLTSPPAKSPTYPSPAPPTKPKPPTQPPVKPPTQPPVKQPTQPPVKPPTYPPVKPPTKPPTSAPVPYKRKLVAVQGVVYCKKNCTYSGVNTLMGASPLSGATVVMRCRNTKYLLRQTATTDNNGYFFLQAPQQITTYGAHKCRVYLAKKPNKSVGPCSHATDLNGGVSGAFLFLNKSAPPPAAFSLFTVGPFAFEPQKCYKH